MERIFTYTISDEQCGQTIEYFLKSQGYSSHLITHLRNTHLGITMNSELVYTTRCLAAGDQLTIKLEETAISDNIVPSPLPLSIVYEDKDLFVINKPADMPVHPSQGNYENTLANALAHYYASRHEPFVYRAINRLDRDTTGLLIIARHGLSACILSDMIKKRTLKRGYLAIVKGRLTPPEGTIDAPIARSEGSTIERCVNFQTGEYAVTHYRTLDYQNGLSLVALTLDTGRTHQIRVHMSFIGHPIPGDFIYHPDFSRIKRQALHSHTLDFNHPITKKAMHFEAPLPEDMLSLFN